MKKEVPQKELDLILDHGSETARESDSKNESGVNEDSLKSTLESIIAAMTGERLYQNYCHL
jgi:hypothetical protein